MDINIANMLSNTIQYIGCDDATLDLFESQYPLPNGMCYNSYLLLGERVAVMDSVDKRKTAEWLQKIEQSHRTPDYLIIQHTEPDHSGSIEAFIEKYPQCHYCCQSRCATVLRAVWLPTCSYPLG